jgi:hypothetical protein
MSGIAASVISGRGGVWGFRKASAFYNNDFSLGSFLPKTSRSPNAAPGRPLRSARLPGCTRRPSASWFGAERFAEA